MIPWYMCWEANFQRHKNILGGQDAGFTFLLPQNSSFVNCSNSFIH